MNFILINKFFLIFLFLIFLTSCSTKSVYQKLKIKTYQNLPVESIDDIDVISTSLNSNKKYNYDDNIILKAFNNKNYHYEYVNIINSEIFALSENINILKFDYNTGEIISTNKINLTISEDNKVTSFYYNNNSFIIAFKSGLIIRTNMKGDVLWKYQSNKVLNTSLFIFEDQLILLFNDEIRSILIKDGRKLWSEIYKDLPLYQAKGGQLLNFINLLFFILPNNKIGSIDLDLGVIHNSKFDEIELISSINNYNDKIHIFDNYLVYLDEGNHMYTYDIFNDDYVLFKNTISSASSKIFFNNSLILKEGNSLQAINIENGKIFWHLKDEAISKKSNILTIRNINSEIEVFLDNGDVLIINNKKLINIDNIGVKDIGKIKFTIQNLIVNLKNGKIIIF